MIVKKNYIISLCNERKHGLLDISNALVMYGNKNEQRLSFLSISNFNNLITFLSQRNNRKEACCVVWDNSLFSFFSTLVLKFFFVKIIYYYHEPDGFKHKIVTLKVNFLLALTQFLAESCFKFLSDLRAVSLKTKLAKANFYLPLLYSDQRPPRLKVAKKIGFIGYVKRERSPELFNQVASILKKYGYEAIFFPSEKYGKSQKEKFKFLAKTEFIWNVFNCPNVLSGVSADAFMSGTPLIVSKYEKFLTLLDKYNLAIRINLNDSPETISKKILEYNYNSIKKKSLIKDQSTFGGNLAYKKFWSPVLNNLFNE